MNQKLNRPKTRCIDCGKDIELRGNRKRCVRCGIREQHRLTKESNNRKNIKKPSN